MTDIMFSRDKCCSLERWRYRTLACHISYVNYATQATCFLYLPSGSFFFNNKKIPNEMLPGS